MASVGGPPAGSVAPSRGSRSFPASGVCSPPGVSRALHRVCHYGRRLPESNGARALTSPRAVAVAAPPGADIRSADLSSMCTMQLGMMYQLLARTGISFAHMRSTVYARSFTDVGPGDVKLVRVARFPVAPEDEDPHVAAQQGTLLLHTEKTWALQGVAAAVDPSYSLSLLEECLVARDVVALPGSSALVFPLVDCAVLVGLLVVEVAPGGQAGGQGQAGHHGAAGVGSSLQQGLWPHGVAGKPGVQGQQDWLGPGAAGTAAAAALLPALCAQPMLYDLRGDGSTISVSASSIGGSIGGSVLGSVEEAAGGAHGGEHGGGGVATAAAVAAGEELHSHDPGAQGGRSLTDEELRCIRLSVPLLSKACGMDARASLQLAQSSLAAAAARATLREAQRPLSVLNTFSTMLVPRLADGEPDKDMAKGIVLQGKRLQDLLWQLDDALHGPGGNSAAPGAGPMGLSSAASGALDAPPPQLPRAGGARGGGSGAAIGSGSGLPAFRALSEPSAAVQELLQLPQRPAALPTPLPAAAVAAPAAAAGSAHAAGSPASPARPHDGAGSSGDASPASSADALGGYGSVSPGRVTVGHGGSSASSSGGVGAEDDANVPLGSALGSGAAPYVLRRADAPPAPPVHYPPQAAQAGQGGAPLSDPGGPGPVRSAGAVVSSALHPDAGAKAAAGAQMPGAAMATIDVETVDGDGRKARALAERHASGASASGSARCASAAGGPSGGGAGGLRAAAAPGAGGSAAMALAATGGAAAAAAVGAAAPTNLVTALTGILTVAMKMAAVSGIAFMAHAPLVTMLPRPRGGKAPAPAPRGSAGGNGAHPAARPAAAPPAGSAVVGYDDAASAAAGAHPPQLIPRPARPLVVGVRSALLQRMVSYMLDIALQCTPRGGQVCVSARPQGSGVALVLQHSGCMDANRMLHRSRGLSPPAPPLPAPAAVPVGALRPGLAARDAHAHGAHGTQGTLARYSLGGGVAATVAAEGGSGGPLSAGALCVAMAVELAQQAGGHLTVAYPCSVANARTGGVDVGTSVELWLPGPGALN